MSESGSRHTSQRPSRTSSRQGHYDPRPHQTGHSSGQPVPANQRFDYAQPSGAFSEPPSRTTVPTLPPRAREPTPAQSRVATPVEPAPEEEPEEHEGDDNASEESPSKDDLYALIETLNSNADYLTTKLEEQRELVGSLRADNRLIQRCVRQLEQELEEAHQVAASLNPESPNTPRDKGKGRAKSLSPVRKPSRTPSPTPQSSKPSGDPPIPPKKDPTPPGSPTRITFNFDSDDEDDMADKVLASAFNKLDYKLKENGSNWTVWSGEIQIIASMIGATSILAGEMTEATPESVKNIGPLFLGYMLLSINTNTRQKHQSTATSTFKLWTALKGEFAKSNPVARAQLKAKFYTCHCKKGHIRNWITELEAHKRKIAEDGTLIEDVTMVEQLLAGAPQEYLGMLISLTAGKEAKDFTPQEIIDALHAQYDMKNAAQTHTPKTQTNQSSTSSYKPKESATPAEPKS